MDTGAARAIGPTQDLRFAHKSCAAAALVFSPDGALLMQLRDDIPEIWLPDHWGCFGGAVNPGESALEAVTREVNEELCIDAPASRFTYFTEISFDLTALGSDPKYRAYFVLDLTGGEASQLRLTEGQALGRFSVDEAVNNPMVTPYDRFALHLYRMRHDFVPESCKERPVAL